MPEFNDVQITGDLQVNGQVDLGGTESTAKFSMAGDYAEFAGVPLGTAKGLLLKGTSQPMPSTEGALLYFDGQRVVAVLPNGHQYYITGF